MSTTKSTKLASLGRATAVKTFTRINNKAVEPRNAGQARTKRISTNHSCVAFLKVPLILAFTLVLTIFAFSAAPALASRGHEYSKSFKPEGAQTLAEPSGVAVNEATGDVYVVDKGNDRVEAFSAEGRYEFEFNGSGEVEVGGVKIEGKEAGSGSGEIKTGRFVEPEGIAIDNSCALRQLSKAECEAQDPSDGDVYVSDIGHSVIDKYSPTGEYIGQITEAKGMGFGSQPLHGLAVDVEGKLWVYREGLTETIELNGFSNAVQNKYENAIPLGGKGLGFPPRGPGLAADAKGAFYVRTGSVAKVGPHGELLIDELGEAGASGVAVDQTNDDSLVDDVTSVLVSDPEGGELESLGKEGGAKHLVEGTGIAVNASAGSIYVADAATGTIVVFAEQSPSAPTVELESESFAEVTSTGVTLGAKIVPRSEPGEAATEYHFEYGACATATTCSTSGYEEVPGSAGQIPGDFAEHTVGATLAGLTANTTYHFRAVARNSHNQENEYVPGEELTFTTEGAGGELVLPDNRGWELVSPPDKQGALIAPISETGVVQAAASGDAITYLANSPTEAEPQGASNQSQVLSRRSSSSWSSSDISIPHAGVTGKSIEGPEYKFFDSELSFGLVQPYGGFDPQLSEEASESTAYLHDLTVPVEACIPASSCYVPLVTRANDTTGQPFGEDERCTPRLEDERTVVASLVCGPEFVGASSDLSHVVLLAKDVALTPGAGMEQLYEWAGGRLSQVSVLPDEKSAEGTARLGFENKDARGAISADGSRIVWEAESNLYLRDMALGASGETVQLDAPEPGCTVGQGEGECESGEGHFQFANEKGTRVFFTDNKRLTSDSGANPASGQHKADLYECQIVLEGEKLACQLHDLTPAQGEAKESAEVQGSLLGGSEDGEYLYFVAKGVLSEAPNARGQRAASGQANLYLRHGATTSFIAALAPFSSSSEGDSHDWDEESLSQQPTRVSPNGQFLELMSEARLTGYDNRDVATGKAAAEVFLYDAGTNALSCASCEPTGARPTGVEYKKLEGANGIVGGPRNIWPEKALVAANVPGWTAIEAGGQSRYQPRYLSDSGRLFFDTDDALVPQDSNGTQDVYEYEPAGFVGPEGSVDCTESMGTYSARSGGCVSLISSGASAQESAFLDASESGNDVFFLTEAKLSPLDQDNALDVYDAHVCSAGSPCISYSSTQSPPCTTEASCKAAPTPQPSIFGAPASSTFQGLGNPAPPAAVKAKAKPLTRAQKLAVALKACKKKPKKQRAGCEKQARKRFGPLKKAKAKAKKGKK